MTLTLVCLRILPFHQQMQTFSSCMNSFLQHTVTKLDLFIICCDTNCTINIPFKLNDLDPTFTLLPTKFNFMHKFEVLQTSCVGTLHTDDHVISIL